MSDVEEEYKAALEAGTAVYESTRATLEAVEAARRASDQRLLDAAIALYEKNHGGNS